MKSEKRTYTIREAAALAGVSVHNITDAIEMGQIPAVRLGKRRIVIPKEPFDRLLASGQMISQE